LFGATGIGLTVAGTRAGTLDGTNLIVGDNGTSGQPLMKHSGMGETDPSYSFVGDQDTGMFWPGADEVALAVAGERQVEVSAATGVNLGGPLATNNPVTISGIFGGVKQLGRAQFQVGASSPGAPKTFPIYTVPAGRTAVVTQILVLLAAAVVGGGGYTAGGPFPGPPGDNTLELNFGVTGATFDEIVDNTINTTIWNPGTYNFDTAIQVMPLGFGDNTFPAISGTGGADYQAYVAGSVVTAWVGTLANLDTFDLDVVVMGYEL
jgi:hypothetical protein